MKKIARRVFLCMAVLAMGVTMTSCDGSNDIIQTILNYIVGGKTYAYKGNYSLQLYGLNPETGNLAPQTDIMNFTNTQVEVKAVNATSFTPASVTLTVPGTKLVNESTGVSAQMSQEVIISGLTINEDELGIGDNTRAQGTLTIGTTEMSVYDLTIDAAVTADEITIRDLIIYFGETGDYAVRVKMPKGTVVSEN